MKQWLMNFWNNNKISAHSVAASIATVTLLYEQVPAFKSLCLSAYSHMPNWSHQVIAAGLGIYALYFRSKQQ